MEGVGRRLNTSDGFLLTVGSHSLNGREHNVLFRNNGDETFSEVGWVNGADLVEDGRGLAVLDSDHDGRLDIVLRNFHQAAGLLQNRRGFAPVCACSDCDFVAECPHCSVPLTCPNP